MKYRKFGKLNWEISEIGFGAWAIGGDMWGPQNDDESIKALHKAIDLGLRATAVVIARNWWARF
ncbi:MAG: hypothetical protein MUE93_07840 [Ignavibacteriaceae bacterium]|nr:hypothetical protein [Ignavibacteriaceae bacterium]